MKIKIEGQDFEGFTSATAERHFLNISGKFTFITSPLDVTKVSYPIRVQQSCQIIVENTL